MLSLAVPSMWDLVASVRQQVAAYLRDLDPELQDAAAMAASELVENAIKYGVPGVSGHGGGELQVERTANELRVRIQSGAQNAAAAHEVMQRILELQRSSDPNALYRQRLS